MWLILNLLFCLNTSVNKQSRSGEYAVWTKGLYSPKFSRIFTPINHYNPEFNFFFFFLPYWGLNLGSTPWATWPALFCDGFFQDRVSRTICLGWLWNPISWVARIIGMSHKHPARI
jgi:hypothetical protein